MEVATDQFGHVVGNPTKLFRISARFAAREKLPVFFVGQVVGETRKAYKMFGRGTLETKAMGVCSICARALTHPVSVTLGIGPQCGGHWWDWDAIGGYSEQVLEKLKVHIENVIVDQWIPKACIIEVHETETRVEVPRTVARVGKLNRDRPPKDTTDPMDTSGPQTFERRAEFAGTKVKVFFPYSKADLERVRMLDGRRFVADLPKHWTCSFTADNVERLHEWGFHLDEAQYKFLHASQEERAKEDADRKDWKFDPNVLRGTLFPYQVEGVEFAERRRGRFLLGDEQGLGKTMQALAYVASHPKLRPVVVVCPAVVKMNWKREAEKWIRKTPKVEILQGKDAYEFDADTDIIIVNYDILPWWVDSLRELKPQIIIADECFPAGTKISTPNGLKNIEDIQVGDEVYNAVGVGVVRAKGNRQADELVRLHLSDGTTMVCTSTHPFFTDNGWVEARNLEGRELLQEGDVFDIVGNIAISRKEPNETNEEAVSGMREDVPAEVSSGSTEREILREVLLSEVEDEAAKRSR